MCLEEVQHPKAKYRSRRMRLVLRDNSFTRLKKKQKKVLTRSGILSGILMVGLILDIVRLHSPLPPITLIGKT